MRNLTLRQEARAEFLEAIAWYEADPGVRRGLVRGFPYGIFFAAFSEEILILAVLHLHRDPETWKDRR